MSEQQGLKVVVVGATGNVGTSIVEALSEEPSVEEIVGVARRHTDWSCSKTRWIFADSRVDDFRPIVRGADAVIHLAWLFQPTHKPEVTFENNVLGAIRVFEAVAEERVPALVYASSVAAYSPGPSDTGVAEDWPTHGWPGAAYPREKAYLERWLDAYELSNPDMRVVRMRPGFIFKRESATAQRRLFVGLPAGRPAGPGRAHPGRSPRRGSACADSAHHRCGCGIRPGGTQAGARCLQPCGGPARGRRLPRRTFRGPSDSHSAARGPRCPVGGVAHARGARLTRTPRHRSAAADHGHDPSSDGVGVAAALHAPGNPRGISGRIARWCRIAHATPARGHGRWSAPGIRDRNRAAAMTMDIATPCASDDACASNKERTG